MDWSALKSELRVELDDGGTTPKWGDEILYTYLREAVSDYSQYFPLAKDEVVLVPLSDVRKFTLPTDFIEEVSVECPLENILEMRKERSGFRISSGSKPSFYYVQGLAMYIDANPSSDNAVISYSAVHPIPLNAADGTFVLTIPIVDIELIKLYVMAKVSVRIRASQSRLDRFKLGSGDRQDNPMVIETEDYFARYYQKIAERMRTTAHTLSRPRRWK
jgi:hypothetical protein